jgi:hypothetical protein
MSAKADTALQHLEDFLGGQPMGNGGCQDHAAAIEALSQG